MRLLSPKELADALGVSESSLKRWVDSGRIRAMRTEGGHRRIPLEEAVRFVRESGAPVARPDLLDMPEVAVAAQRTLQGVSSFLDHLLEGDVVAARGWLLSRYLAGESLPALCDGPIKEAMHTIGNLWRHDAGGIYIEHRATDVCLQALAHLRGTIDPPAHAPLALGGTPEDDPYLLPSFMCATVLAAAGMRTINLGADTPLAALQHAVAVHRPHLVWVSASAPIATDTFGRWLKSLAPTTTVVCGGQASQPLVDAGVPVLGTMTELYALAKSLSKSAARTA